MTALDIFDRIFQWVFYLFIVAMPVACAIAVLRKRCIAFLFAGLAVVGTCCYFFFNQYRAPELKKEDFESFYTEFQESLGEETEETTIKTKKHFIDNNFIIAYIYNKKSTLSASTDIHIYKYPTQQEAKDDFQISVDGGIHEGYIKNLKKVSFSEGDFDAVCFPVERSTDVCIMPLSYDYESYAYIRYKNYYIQIIEISPDKTRMGEAVRSVVGDYPNLEDWLTHDLSKENKIYERTSA